MKHDPYHKKRSRGDIVKDSYNREHLVLRKDKDGLGYTVINISAIGLKNYFLRIDWEPSDKIEEWRKFTGKTFDEITINFLLMFVTNDRTII